MALVDMMDMMVLGLLALLVVILFVLINKNSKLHAENKKLNEILAVKDITIANYEASRVAVKDVIENIASIDDVMNLVNQGESKEAVAKKLGIPLSKVELIIKFDKIKNKS